MNTKFKQVDALPMVKHYMAELGLHELFDGYVPNLDKPEPKRFSDYLAKKTRKLELRN